MLELKCQHCGETFVAKLARAKWCSNRCREAIRVRVRSRVKPKFSLFCHHCGSAFAAKFSWAKWCSSKCSCAGLYKISPSKKKEISSGWRKMNPDKHAERLRVSRNKAAATNALAHVANEIRKLNGDQNDQSE